MQDQNALFEKLMEDLLSGAISHENKIILFSMIGQSEELKKKYEDYALLNALMNLPELEKQKDKDYNILIKRLNFKTEDKVKGFVSRWVYIVAASILLAIVSSVVSIYFYNNISKTQDNMLCQAIVPFGNQAKIMLPDSSVVYLNAGSILKYPVQFGRKHRTVYLEGEGFFEVTKSNKPFHVVSKNIKVTVLGTTFNMRSYLDEPVETISLLKGSVNVTNGKRIINLKPDEQIVYNSLSETFKLTKGGAYKASIWTTGKLSFVNTQFLEILKSIERKFNIKIQVKSKNIGNEVFSGTISADMPLQEVFNFIDMDKKYLFEVSGNTIIMNDR